MAKIVRNALPLPGIPWYGVTIRWTVARGWATSSASGDAALAAATASAVPSLDPPSELTQTARHAREELGQAGGDGAHHVADGAGVVEARDADEQVGPAQFGQPALPRARAARGLHVLGAPARQVRPGQDGEHRYVPSGWPGAGRALGRAAARASSPD